MNETIVSLTLSVIGLIGLIIGLLFIITGLLKKNKKLKTRGLIILIIPTAILGLMIVYYQVYLPVSFRWKERVFSGTYIYTVMILEKPLTYQLILNQDHTFRIDSVSAIPFKGHGNWIAKKIDGDIIFWFTDSRGQQLGWATPNKEGKNKEIIFWNYDSVNDQIHFKKVE